MSTASQIFKTIANAKINNGGVYFLPGTYEVSVCKAFLMTSRKGTPLIVVEAEVLSTDVPSRPVGTRASWVVNMTQDAAASNIKSFIAAAIGINPGDQNRVDEEVTPDFVEQAFSDDNPLEGVKLRLQCSTIKTKAGTDFTRHMWSPMDN